MRKGIVSGILIFLLGVGGVVFAQWAAVAETDHSEAKLVPVDLPAGAKFGASLAVDGETAVAGAPGADGIAQNSGAAYVLRQSGDGWQQQAKLAASDGIPLGNFGRAVAISEDVIVVGAGGAAYVFRMDRASGEWREQAKLIRPSGAGGRFGMAVAVSGGRVLVGAPYASNNQGETTPKGFIYFFRENETGLWELEASFNSLSSSTGDHFGVSLDIDGKRAVVGAPGWGQVFVYEHDGTRWQVSAEVRDPQWGSNRAFGQTVVLQADLLAVGAPSDAEQGHNAGAAYVYRLKAGKWLEEAKLTPWQVATGERFGSSSALDGDYLAIGAPYSKGVVDAEESGAVYLCYFDGGAWIEQAMLTASDATAYDHLGAAVAVNAAGVLAAAPDQEGEELESGAAYAFAMKGKSAPATSINPVSAMHTAPKMHSHGQRQTWRR